MIAAKFVGRLAFRSLIIFMEFLKSAVASAISKGPPIPFNFGDQVGLDTSIWTLYNGTKREDGSSCSIFSFNINANKLHFPLARNAVKKLRTLRHPKVIKILDTVETESHIYIATERVDPLKWHIKRKSLSAETIKWGLFNIAQTIKFINGEATSIHGALGVRSIFISESGEWRLAGFEVLSSMKDDDLLICSHGSLLPDAGRYIPPELSKFGWDSIKKYPLTSIDAYHFGVLIYEAFNGDFPGNLQPGHVSNIPLELQSGYRRLINNNPKVRISVQEFLDQGIQHNGFFNTPLIALTETVEQLGTKSEQEKEEFLNDFDRISKDLPGDYFMMKVLPELLKCVEFGRGGPKVLAVIMDRSKKLSDHQFDQKITPTIIRLFGSPDRAIRVCLLDNLPLMIDRLTQKNVNDKIFPQMITGFTDIAPVVREQTIKAVLTIINKLSDKTINGELLKYLAKTSNDEQPGIRTNTTICLGKISKNLSASTRPKVLIAAFTRSLRDPFVHARNAALMALAVTSFAFSEDDSACRILPALCPCLIDKEKIVREQAYKTMEIYLKKLRNFAATMPDSVLKPLTADSSNGVPRMGISHSNDAASWTGWAISSFTHKISGVAGEIISSNSTAGPNTRSTSPSFANSFSSTPTCSSPIHNQTPEKLPKKSNLLSNSQSLLNESPPNRPVNVDNEFDNSWKNHDNLLDFSPSTANITSNGPFIIPDCKDQEPDFADWLEAQARKKANHKPLPKGLTRPMVVSRSTTFINDGCLSAKSSKQNQPITRVIAKKVDTTPLENEEDDGWGDGW